LRPIRGYGYGVAALGEHGVGERHLRRVCFELIAEGLDRGGVDSERAVDVAGHYWGWWCYQLGGAGCGSGEILGSNGRLGEGRSWGIGSTMHGDGVRGCSVPMGVEGGYGLLAGH
jgi:hypothetical protein